MTAPARYIAFEGPIAAGKTTLARMLAEWIGAETIHEEFEENEFLADFYADQQRWALPMQLAFLASRNQQLSAVDPSRRARSLVADHTYAKDLMFATMILRGRELRLYRTIQRSLAGKVAEPDLIFYLDAPTDVLLQRIRRRGRPYEAAIDAAYLDRLRAAYERDILPRPTPRSVRIVTSTFSLTDGAALARVRESMLAACGLPG